ncbi:hypothetical protein BG015_010236 [Linnemannia schmuckeri]|uniref:Uncharacterized protein n=1 Tax=Linnemannia schmuckeri TaxID=64567 RepID=A0A9P5V978_9FUNG|nr:hypothetical protein BG015_010236 [Linnemannia schmuckeri]
MSKLPAEIAQYEFINRNNSNGISDSSSGSNTWTPSFAGDSLFGFGLGHLGASPPTSGNVVTQLMTGGGVDRDMMSLFTESLLENRFSCPSQRRATNNANSTTSSSRATVPEPSGKEILLHLLKRCPDLLSLELVSWDDSDIKEDWAFWRAISNDVVHRLRDLNIKTPIRTHLSRSSPYTVLLLLAHCSSKMRTLKLQMFANSSPVSSPLRGARQSKGKSVEVPKLEPEIDDSPLTTRCINLKHLEVTKISPTWYGAVRGCVHLRKLVVHEVDSIYVQFIANALRTNLHYLDEIEILQDYNDLEKGVVADMISSCRNGWKLVDIPTLDTAAADTLVKHCPTLERLDLRRSASLSSFQMRQILSTSPRLTTFRDWFESSVAKFMVEDFIDLDSITNTLRPWACESTLKVFVAKVAKILRSDVTKIFTDIRAESQELQHRVYERLARFTHLEELELGHDDRNWDNDENYADGADGNLVYHDEGFQYECVDLTLKNGLGLLEGLKELMRISFMRMATRVGKEEIKWMVESWPKLKYIAGLYSGVTEEEEAAAWLEKKHPDITVVHYSIDVSIVPRPCLEGDQPRSDFPYYDYNNFMDRSYRPQKELRVSAGRLEQNARFVQSLSLSGPFCPEYYRITFPQLQKIQLHYDSNYILPEGEERKSKYAMEVNDFWEAVFSTLRDLIKLRLEDVNDLQGSDIVDSFWRACTLFEEIYSKGSYGAGDVTGSGGSVAEGIGRRGRRGPRGYVCSSPTPTLLHLAIAPVWAAHFHSPPEPALGQYQGLGHVTDVRVFEQDGAECTRAMCTAGGFSSCDDQRLVYTPDLGLQYSSFSDEDGVDTSMPEDTYPLQWKLGLGLDRLRTLEKLKTIAFEDAAQEDMEVEDLVWMKESLPALKELYGTFSEDETRYEELEKIIGDHIYE